MYRKSTIQGVALLAVLMMLVSCASMSGHEETFTSTSYKTLSSAATVYDRSMKSIADLYKQGLIDDDIKDEAIRLGNIFWASYHPAVEALKAYESSSTPADKESAEAKLMAFQRNYTTFMSFAQPILQKYLMEEQ